MNFIAIKILIITLFCFGEFREFFLWLNVKQKVTIDNIYNGKDIKFTLLILNERLQPVKEIKYRNNFNLYLKIENKTNTDKYIGRWDFPVSNPTFFEIYTVQKHQIISIGKPFRLYTNSKDLSAQEVPALGQIEYLCPWFAEGPITMPTYNGKQSYFNSRTYMSTNSAKSVLQKGKYFLSFTLNYKKQEIKLSNTFYII